MLLLVVVPLFAACNRTAKFDFAYTNRDSTGIIAQVNAKEYGSEIAPSTSQQFTIALEILESSPTGPNTADVAQVTVAARSPKRGKVSQPRTMTVWSDRVNPVTINPEDFR
jgi:hypothetical protein